MLSDPHPALRVEVDCDATVTVVTVSGELGLTTAAELNRRLGEVSAAGPERLLLDLRALAFVDVAGARALDRLHKELAAQCPVAVHWPRPSARGATGLVSEP